MTLGLDLSLTATGLAFCNGLAAMVDIVASKPSEGGGKPEDERLQGILTAIGDYVVLHGPSLVAIEGLSFGSKGGAAFTRAGLHYLVRNWLLVQGIPYVIVPPTTLKKWASGKGNARKDDMKLHAYKLYGFEHKDDNAVDAYLLARLAAQIKGHDQPKNATQRDIVSKLS